MVTTEEINKTQMFAKTRYVACFYCIRTYYMPYYTTVLAVKSAYISFDARRLHRYYVRFDLILNFKKSLERFA